MDSDALLRLVKSKLVQGEPPEPRGERMASVAIILKEGPSLETLMIKRAEREGDPWSGQVAFPGGRRERQDKSLLETATRETREEVGIDLGSAIYLGHLGAFRTHTGTMLVVPCTFLRRTEERVEPNAEVSSYRWIPMEVFLRENSRSTNTLKRGGENVNLPAYVYQDYVIWGLSYRMISALLGRE